MAEQRTQNRTPFPPPSRPTSARSVRSQSGGVGGSSSGRGGISGWTFSRLAHTDPSKTEAYGARPPARPDPPIPHGLLSGAEAVPAADDKGFARGHPAGPGRPRDFARDAKFVARDPLGYGYGQRVQPNGQKLPDREYFTLPNMSTLDISKVNQGRHNWQKIDTFQTPYYGGEGSEDAAKEYKLRESEPKDREQAAQGTSSSRGSATSESKVAPPTLGEEEPYYTEQQDFDDTMRIGAVEIMRSEIKDGVALLREDIFMLLNSALAGVKTETTAIRQEMAKALADTRTAVDAISSQLAERPGDRPHVAGVSPDAASVVKEVDETVKLTTDRHQMEGAAIQETELLRRLEEGLSRWPSLGDVQAMREHHEQLQNEVKKQGDLTASLVDITQSIRTSIEGLDQKIPRTPPEINLDLSRVTKAIDEKKFDVDLSQILVAMGECNARVLTALKDRDTTDRADTFPHFLTEFREIQKDFKSRESKIEAICPALEERLATIAQMLDSIKSEVEAGVDFTSVVQAIENCAIQLDTSTLKELLQEIGKEVQRTKAEVQDTCKTYDVSSDVDTDGDWDVKRMISKEVKASLTAIV